MPRSFHLFGSRTVVPEIALIVNTTANGYRIPTDYELEYVCRTGSVGPFHIGSNAVESYVPKYARCAVNAQVNGAGQVASCGFYMPNDWGFRDTLGNVGEMSVSGNQLDADQKEQYVAYGGTWAEVVPYCGIREYFPANARWSHVGLRVVADVR